MVKLNSLIVLHVFYQIALVRGSNQFSAAFRLPPLARGWMDRKRFLSVNLTL